MPSPRRRQIFYDALGPGPPVKLVSLHPRYHGAIQDFRQRQIQGKSPLGLIKATVKVTAKRPGWRVGEIWTTDLVHIVYEHYRGKKIWVKTIDVNDAVSRIPYRQIYYGGLPNERPDPEPDSGAGLALESRNAAD